MIIVLIVFIIWPFKTPLPPSHHPLPNYPIHPDRHFPPHFLTIIILLIIILISKIIVLIILLVIMVFINPCDHCHHRSPNYDHPSPQSIHPPRYRFPYLFLLLPHRYPPHHFPYQFHPHQAFKVAEIQELKAIKRLRAANLEKLPYLDKALDEAQRVHRAKNVSSDMPPCRIAKC